MVTNTFYFLHIHKTAGSTFIGILDRFFPTNAICRAQQWHQLLAIPEHEVGRYQLFRGHFHYCLHTLLPRPPLFMTLLRDPVERAISRFQHLRRDHLHYLYPLARSMSLHEFLRHPLTRAQVHNLQVRHLAYDFDIRAFATSLGIPLTARLEMEETINQLLNDLPDDELLEIAKERLKAFTFIGITERFQESLDLLSHQMLWQRIKEVENRNVAPERMSRSDIDPEALEQLVALNRADIDLYQFAQTLFQQRLRDMHVRQMS